MYDGKTTIFFLKQLIDTKCQGRSKGWAKGGGGGMPPRKNMGAFPTDLAL